MRWGLILLSFTVIVILGYLGALGWFVVRLAGEQSSHLAWQLKLGSMRDMVPDILPDGTICCGSDQRLNWVNPDGTLAAQYEGGPLMDNGCAWFAGAGNLWFVGPVSPPSTSGLPDARLLAFNKQARIEWELKLTPGTQVQNICLSTDRVLAQLDSGYLCSVDLEGRLLWSKLLDASGYGGMTLSPDGTFYFISSNFHLVCVDQDGAERWRVPLLSMGSSRPEISSSGTVYVLDDYSHLYAISAAGKKLWKFVPPPPATTMLEQYFGYGLWSPGGAYIGNGFVPAAAPDGSVYFCNWDGILYAVDAQGQLKWSRPLDGECTAPAIGADGTVYVAIAGQGVRAYYPNGRLKWRNRGVREINSAPIIGRDGKLYVDTIDSLVAFDP